MGVDDQLQVKVRIGIGQRCSDYDEDCKEVPCHIRCWLGGLREVDGVEHVLPPADGYCPFLRI